MTEENLNIQDHVCELIIKALNKSKNKREIAARYLGVSCRTLNRYIKIYDLGFDYTQWRKKTKHEIRQQRNSERYSSIC